MEKSKNIQKVFNTIFWFMKKKKEKESSYSYLVVESGNLEEFNKTVNDHIETGYRIVEGHKVNLGEDGVLYSQLLLRFWGE